MTPRLHVVFVCVIRFEPKEMEVDLTFGLLRGVGGWQ